MKPLVSVVVPIFNTEKYIERAVTSICNQTYNNIQIILVNDGSPDHSEEVCLRLKEEDDRIDYFYQENKGVSAARNLGINNVKGKYVLFCDSDDAWEKDLLEVVVGEIEKKEECDLVQFGFISNDKELYKEDRMMDIELSQKEFLVEYFSNNQIYRNLSSSCFGIFKSKIIKDNHLHFDENMRRGEDTKFVMQYLICCRNIKMINKLLYHYYQYTEERVSATAKNIKEAYNEYELCCILFEEFYRKWDNELSSEEKTRAYGAFYDRLIGRLVRFAAYSSSQTRAKDKDQLSKLLCTDYVEVAGHYYRPKRKSDSRVIPICMRHRWAGLLWFVLRLRRKKYYQSYGKKRYIDSIWKSDPLLEL